MLRLCLLVCLLNCVWCVDYVTVYTSKGSVRGQLDASGNFSTFLGIPYAKVDENNPFGKSLPVEKFDTFIADDKTIKCPQKVTPTHTPQGTLDCLRLNIYVPKKASSELLPVFVWIHGGVFKGGNGGEYGGRHLVSHDIIVVTINYRLGPYGFLCLDDPTVPGNQGLKDQETALKWIKENIKFFGGQPDDVTIAGESAGGGSVDLHLYSKGEALFHKAIIESGSSFVDGMFSKADHAAAIKLAKKLEHNATNTKDALKFLTKAEPTAVLKAFQDLQLELRPCQEKRFNGVHNFVTDDPFHIRAPSRIKEIPILQGVNSKEDFFLFVKQPADYYDTIQDIFYNKLKKVFDLRDHQLQSLARIVKKFYLGSKPISIDSMLELVDFSSDFVMNHAGEMSVTKYLMQGAPKVYKYLFSYVGRYTNVTGAGASHGDEMNYLFELDRSEPSEHSDLIRARMTKMWSNFVKYGNPTPEVSDLLPVRWIPVTNGSSDSRPCLNIDVNMKMIDQVYSDRMAFWDLMWDAHGMDSVLIDKHKFRGHRHHL